MSQINDQELDRLYYVNVGEKGTFKPGKNPIFNSTPEQIDDIFMELKRKGQRKIVLYFHGGLVPAQDGLKTAERIKKYVLRDTDAYPISFVWQTGLKETIEHNLLTIHKSDFFRRLLIRILKVAGERIGMEYSGDLVTAKGGGGLSDAQIQAELDKDSPFEGYYRAEGAKSGSLDGSLAWNAELEKTETAEVKAMLEQDIEADIRLRDAAAREKPPEEAALMNQEDLEESPDNSKGIIPSAKLIKGAVEITLRVIKRYLQKRDHDFYPTVFEEVCRQYYLSDIGNWVWGGMKEKAALMWKPSDLQADYRNWTVGYYFIQKLEEYNKHMDGTLSINLIGHSAGSIVICELLEQLAEQGSTLHFKNVIFMAPAVRCDRFVHSALKNRSFFDAFRCFTMNDGQEKKDRMLKMVYPYSLLYFISGILEEESDAYILGLQRHISGVAPYHGADFDEIINFLKPDGSIIYAVTELPGADGLRSGALTHGGFDDEGETTLDSMMYLIKQ